MIIETLVNSVSLSRLLLNQAVDSACLGAHCIEPYERNTQQSPGLELNRASHLDAVVEMPTNVGRHFLFFFKPTLIVPGGRLVIMDVKYPERWPLWLLILFVGLARPFGLSLGCIERRPWESVEHHFQQTAFEQMYGGMVYISSGTTPLPAA